MRLCRPWTVTRQSRFVATAPGAIAKLYVPAAFVDVRATGLNPL